MADLEGARAEFVRQARLELNRINLLPKTQRDEAWSEAYGGGAIRDLANLPEFSQDWMEAPSNSSVSLTYLKRNPAPTVTQLNIEYLLKVLGGQLLLEVAGVKGGDESRFRVKALLAGQDKGTYLFWVRIKKTEVTATQTQRVSAGRISAAGTGKTKVQGPEIDSVVTLEGQNGRDNMSVRIKDYNLKRGILFAKKTSE